jgi:hypothetical protein
VLSVTAISLRTLTMQTPSKMQQTPGTLSSCEIEPNRTASPQRGPLHACVRGPRRPTIFTAPQPRSVVRWLEKLLTTRRLGSDRRAPARSVLNDPGPGPSSRCKPGVEPPVGVEPTTYRLQDVAGPILACHALAEQMSRHRTGVVTSALAHGAVTRGSVVPGSPARRRSGWRARHRRGRHGRDLRARRRDLH